MIYCPQCFNDSLNINSRGVVDVIINSKQMDAGRFLFNRGKDDQEEILESFIEKLEEFFRWYSNFQNKEPIKKVEIVSGDFTCEQGCKMEMGFRTSVVGSLISQERLDEVLNEMCERFELELEI